MKIGITGAQSVGKTTLLNALRSEPRFDGYTVCDEVTREIREMGFDINEQGSDLTQILIMQKHISNVFMYDDMLTDRTALDGLVYTTWMHQHNKVTQATLEKVYSIYEKLINSYDYIFYIRPEFPIIDDGVRSIDPQFRDDINDIFEGFINELPREHITVSGSVRERVSQVLKVVGR
jgi:nicotinamide riboside kinase|tara:strand:- start:178 stop:708 length:531 start_codon:yes stop_codon:yes gene_type:complete